LVKGGFDIPKIVYGRTLQELSKLPDEKLAEYYELLDKDSFVKELKGKVANFISIRINSDLRSSTTRKYSSWKLGLSSLVVAPKINSTVEAYNDSMDLYNEMMAVKEEIQEVKAEAQIPVADDEFED
jgi:hypothetical protein